MVDSGECGAVLEMVECLNRAPKRASWIEMEFDVFAVCLHLGKREKRLSATPSFPLPTDGDLKQSIIGARFPWRTLLAKSQSDVFVSTFFRMPTTKQTWNLETYTWISSAH
jgi:hypothetical protein